jgi:hypothetical protein
MAGVAGHVLRWPRTAGRAGVGRLGAEWLGLAGMAAQVRTWHGQAGTGWAGVARRVGAGNGPAWQAGIAWGGHDAPGHVRDRLGRRGWG